MYSGRICFSVVVVDDEDEAEEAEIEHLIDLEEEDCWDFRDLDEGKKKDDEVRVLGLKEMEVLVVGKVMLGFMKTAAMDGTEIGRAHV